MSRIDQVLAGVIFRKALPVQNAGRVVAARPYAIENKIHSSVIQM